MFAFLDLTEIVLVTMRADEICAAVMWASSDALIPPIRSE